MNKITKGAFAMVLAGSVTFSVTNALLAEPIKRLTKEIALPISGHPKKVDVISKAEKAKKEQTPTSNVKDGQTKLSQKQVAFNTTTNSASTNEAPTTTKHATSAKAPTTTTVTKPTGTDTKSATTRPATTTKPATSAKAPTTPTVTKPTGSITKSATKTTTNRGQQVSQEAKEKAASHREQKENNGKKM